MTTEPLTRCWLDTCRDIAHVVLYASGDKLGGQITRPRQPIVLCLKHGEQVYDVIHAWNHGVGATTVNGSHVVSNFNGKRKSAPCPTWLVADMRNGRLPRTSPDPSGWPAASWAATARRKG